LKVKDDKIVLSIIEDKIMINETLSKLIKIDIFSEENKMKLPVNLFFNVGPILLKVDFIHVTINGVYINNLGVNVMKLLTLLSLTKSPHAFPCGVSSALWQVWNLLS